MIILWMSFPVKIQQSVCLLYENGIFFHVLFSGGNLNGVKFKEEQPQHTHIFICENDNHH